VNAGLAKELLEQHGAACIILRNDKIIFTHVGIGVKPLIAFMEKPLEERSGSLVLVDKVIGKAALLMAVKLGIKNIYTPLVSEEALDAAGVHGVTIDALETVPYIINRTNDGKCPLEQSVTGIYDPEIAFVKIKQAISELMKKTVTL
jgi:hypothetical protein